MFQFQQAIVIVGLFLILATFSVQAQENAKGEAQAGFKPERNCLMVQKIKKIEIVDNQTILFYTYHGETWRNRLAAACQGLKIEGGIRYSSSGNLICDLDTVTVLNLGTPCMLGKFEKIEK